MQADRHAQPLPNSTVHTDKKEVCSWCYSASNREMVTYDTAEIAAIKGSFIHSNGFGGAMYWELSGDKPLESGEAIVPTVANAMHSGLDNRPNHLNYPDSKFDNLRKRMES